jgi:hypothetical protein
MESEISPQLNNLNHRYQPTLSEQGRHFVKRARFQYEGHR